jgi:hypothetical protein
VGGYSKEQLAFKKSQNGLMLKNGVKKRPSTAILYKEGGAKEHRTKVIN